MVHPIELDDDLVERMNGHLEDDETLEEFIEELVTIYEQEGRFLQEGASKLTESHTTDGQRARVDRHLS
jgi:outer membrane protein assembly factor BamA